ncbi:MAG TPA: hypothetical protein VNK04_02865 [Gemmataceae bacterium]|nr:hypothetical protein [Gemmataceae bacterium]
MPKRALSLLVALVVTAVCLAQDEKKSGLQPGDELPGPFRPYNVTGKFGERTIKELGGKETAVEGQFHCLVCDYGLAPVAMVFVRNADLANPPEPLLKLLKELHDLVQKHRNARLGAFAVFLSDDLPDVVTDDEKRDELAKQLKDHVDKGAELALGENVVLALESKKYLANYPLDDNAVVTVVLYRNYKVVETLTFAKFDAINVEAVAAKVKEMVAAKK